MPGKIIPRDVRRLTRKRGAVTTGPTGLGRAGFRTRAGIPVGFKPIASSTSRKPARKRLRKSRRPKQVGPPKVGMRQVKGRGGVITTVRRPRPEHA